MEPIRGKPWKQDKNNHYVDLWLPWRIGFMRRGNHSITAGILAGEGALIRNTFTICHGVNGISEFVFRILK
ncbi:DUF6710 family protein [Escherichia coli]